MEGICQDAVVSGVARATRTIEIPSFYLGHQIFYTDLIGNSSVDMNVFFIVGFILQDKDKTLNDKQIETVMAKLQHNLETQLNATIRQ